MVCEQCGEAEAAIHLTQIVDDEMGTFHLCEACAAEKGLDAGTNIGNLPLSDFLKQMNEGLPTEPEVEADSCPYCGMELEEFKNSGRLGCSQCYVTFEPHLRTLLRRLHGGTRHVGKVYLPPDPSSADREQRLTGLRRKLAKAVEDEEFERAADLRDEIRNLEGVSS